MRKKKESIDLTFTRDELEAFLEMIPNIENKKNFIQKIKNKLPHVPEWLTFDAQVKSARKHFNNDLIPGVTPREEQGKVDQEHQEQPE